MCVCVCVCIVIILEIVFKSHSRTIVRDFCRRVKIRGAPRAAEQFARRNFAFAYTFITYTIRPRARRVGRNATVFKNKKKQNPRRFLSEIRFYTLPAPFRNRKKKNKKKNTYTIV